MAILPHEPKSPTQQRFNRYMEAINKLSSVDRQAIIDYVVWIKTTAERQGEQSGYSRAHSRPGNGDMGG